MTDNDRDPRPTPVVPAWRKYLPWIIGAIILLLLLLMLSRCGNDRAVVDPSATETATVPMEAPVMPANVAPVGVSGLDAYLAGSDVAPRTFAFERVNFDTGASAIRAQDRPEIMAVADVLKRYPNAGVRLYGYADARGSDPANRTLARARADIVRSALTAAGVDARQIEALSGGEANPVDNNATAGGQAENRRTELVVVQR